MEKDTHLLNIYLKIHNKKCLTMDDLQYLAMYSPECFEKTCKNVIYNFPDAKPVLENTPNTNDTPHKEHYLPAVISDTPEHLQEKYRITCVLENIKHLEQNELPQTGVNARQVKELLGNLFMELLFPHNDTIASLYMPEEPASTIDFKA